MPTEKKAQSIKKIEEELAKANIGIFTDYRGLKTSEINSLRHKIQDIGGDYKVIKNTLARKAAENLNRSEITNSLEGPTAVAFGYDDIPQLAKTLSDYVRTSKMNLIIKGGFLNDRLLTVDDVNVVATLPSKEILISKVVSGIKSPLYMLASALSGPIRGLQNVLQARIKQMEVNN